MSDYNFIEAFAAEVNKPLDAWDISGGAAGGADEFFKQLGEISKAIQEGTLTPADAARTKALLQSFSDGLNRINGGLAQVAAANAQDARFAQSFKAMVSATNLGVQRVSYALDEIAAGIDSTSIQKFSATASATLKNVGGVLGLMQIADEFRKNGLTAVGVDEAGKKALGVLTGLAGGEVAALAVGVVAAGMEATA